MIIPRTESTPRTPEIKRTQHEPEVVLQALMEKQEKENRVIAGDYKRAKEYLQSNKLNEAISSARAAIKSLYACKPKIEIYGNGQLIDVDIELIAELYSIISTAYFRAGKFEMAFENIEKATNWKYANYVHRFEKMLICIELKKTQEGLRTAGAVCPADERKLSLFHIYDAHLFFLINKENKDNKDDKQSKKEIRIGLRSAFKLDDFGIVKLLALHLAQIYEALTGSIINSTNLLALLTSDEDGCVYLGHEPDDKFPVQPSTVLKLYETAAANVKAKTKNHEEAIDYAVLRIFAKKLDKEDDVKKYDEKLKLAELPKYPNTMLPPVMRELLDLPPCVNVTLSKEEESGQPNRDFMDEVSSLITKSNADGFGTQDLSQSHQSSSSASYPPPPTPGPVYRSAVLPETKTSTDETKTSQPSSSQARQSFENNKSSLGLEDDKKIDSFMGLYKTKYPMPSSVDRVKIKELLLENQSEGTDYLLAIVRSYFESIEKTASQKNTSSTRVDPSPTSSAIVPKEKPRGEILISSASTKSDSKGSSSRSHQVDRYRNIRAEIYRTCEEKVQKANPKYNNAMERYVFWKFYGPKNYSKKDRLGKYTTLREMVDHASINKYMTQNDIVNLAFTSKFLFFKLMAKKVSLQEMNWKAKTTINSKELASLLSTYLPHNISPEKLLLDSEFFETLLFEHAKTLDPIFCNAITDELNISHGAEFSTAEEVDSVGNKRIEIGIEYKGTVVTERQFRQMAATLKAYYGRDIITLLLSNKDYTYFRIFLNAELFLQRVLPVLAGFKPMPTEPKTLPSIDDPPLMAYSCTESIYSPTPRR